MPVLPSSPTSLPRRTRNYRRYSVRRTVAVWKAPLAHSVPPVRVPKKLRRCRLIPNLITLRLYRAPRSTYLRNEALQG